LITSRLSGSVAVMTLVSTLCLTAGASASAAPTAKSLRTSAVTASSCAAAGGTFTQVSGVRSCATALSVATDGAPVTAEASLITESWPGGGAQHLLLGTSLRRTTSVTTTTRSQSGLRAVEVSSAATLMSQVVQLSCVERVITSSSGFTDRVTGARVEGSRTTTDTEMPLLRCERDGLFVA
jgi:hypothetical protein